MSIGKSIKQLLEERNRVILPGFGNLEVKEAGSSVPAPGKRIDPPGLSIKFDSSFSKDDGVLATAFSEAEGIEKAEAEQQVLELVDAIRFALDKGEPYSLSEAGTFRRDEEGKIHFQATPGWVLEPEQYGLDSMDLLELEDLPLDEEESMVGDSKADEQAVPNSTPVLETEKAKEAPAEPASGPNETAASKPVMQPPVKPKPKQAPKAHEPWKDKKTKNRSGLWRTIWIIAGILLAVLVVLILIPAEKWEMAGKKDHTGEAVQAEQPAETPAASGQPTDGKDNADETVETAPVVEPLPVKSDVFFIIAGSFSHLGNASELQDQLKAKGYPAEVMITENRMYRVSVASYASQSEAETSLVRIQSEPGMESCWLLSNE